MPDIAATAQPAIDAAALAARITSLNLSRRRVTVVGYGKMGRQYVKALRALGVDQIRVCGRRTEPLRELAHTGVEVHAGGYDQLPYDPACDLLIVATPMADLVPASWRLSHGLRGRLLVEKPVAITASDVRALQLACQERGLEARVAYNRAAYPAVAEVKARTWAEGGITSCTYAFTEIFHPSWLESISAAELARWGIANSLHVMSLAHALIGAPREWYATRSGTLSWHPSGSVFVGAGRSAAGIPFSYHADWASTGRWGVEVHTAVASYQLCPLEEVKRRSVPRGPWDPIPLTAFAPEVKAGIVEQVASLLAEPGEMPDLLPTLADAARLTDYAESVFGYE